MRPTQQASEASLAAQKSRFDTGTLMGIKIELLNINRGTQGEQAARASANRQFQALEQAIQRRNEDPGKLFSKFPRDTFAFLTAAFYHLEGKYPDLGSRRGIHLEAKDYTQIKKDAASLKESGFTISALTGIKYELLQMNRKTQKNEQAARNSTNRQFQALEQAMKNRKKDPSRLFSRFPGEQSDFLLATFKHFDNKYPKNFPGFPPGVHLEAKEYAQIKEGAAAITKIRTKKYRTVTNVAMPDGRYNFVFSHDLSQKERRDFLQAIRQWKRDRQFTNLATLFLNVNIHPSKCEKIMPDKTLRAENPGLVFNHSMITGDAKDYVYNKLGLGSREIYGLEYALSQKAKNRDYRPDAFFKRLIKDKTKRDNLDTAFNTISNSKKYRGRFLTYESDTEVIKSEIETREKALAAYRQPLSLKTWNIASISTPQGLYYLRIPKSLVPEKKFNQMIRDKKTPEDFAVGFSLGSIYDQLVTRRERGSFVPLTDKETAELNKTKPKDLYYAVLPAKKPAEEKKKGRRERA